MIPILSHTALSYSNEVMQKLQGKGGFYAELIYKTWIRKGKLYNEESNASSLISEIIALTDFSLPQVFTTFDTEQTKKGLLQTKDGHLFEMVLLPMKSGWTLCVSSQIGCKIGCAFCETAKMGLIRSLSVEEITSQLFLARHHFGYVIRNIVFMGMGEPFDNYEAVMQAIQIFTDMNGFAIGTRHITVSTSGLVDKIQLFSKQAPPSLNLAISINAPTEAKREKLMPISKQYNMNNLREAMVAYLHHPRREILVEYVMIEGKNDSLDDAYALALYLKDLRVKINLIPYNKQRRGVFQAPDKETVDAFAQRLREHGYVVLIRQTKGEQIMAACGQLGNRKNSLVFSS